MFVKLMAMCTAVKWLCGRTLHSKARVYAFACHLDLHKLKSFDSNVKWFEGMPMWHQHMRAECALNTSKP
jgi:hypothetical protein